MHATDARKGSAAGRYRLESQEDGVSHKRMMLIGISATTIQDFAIALMNSHKAIRVECGILTVFLLSIQSSKCFLKITFQLIYKGRCCWG
jgi:hypothetical protein